MQHDTFNSHWCYITFLTKLMLTLRLLVWFIICISIVYNAIAAHPKIKGLEMNLRYVAAGNQWKEAITAADELLKYKPKHARAHFEKGWALAHLGKHKEAIVSFDLAIKCNFKYLSCAYYEIGNSLKALDMLEEALVCYTKAIRLGYDHRSVYHYRNEVLMQLGRLGKDLDPI